MTLDFSINWIDDSGECEISLSPCPVCDCVLTVCHTYYSFPELCAGGRIKVSVQNTHGMYSAVVAVYAGNEKKPINYTSIMGAEKGLFRWFLDEELICAKQALISFGMGGAE